MVIRVTVSVPKQSGAETVHTSSAENRMGCVFVKSTSVIINSPNNDNLFNASKRHHAICKCELCLWIGSFYSR